MGKFSKLPKFDFSTSYYITGFVFYPTILNWYGHYGRIHEKKRYGCREESYSKNYATTSARNEHDGVSFHGPRAAVATPSNEASNTV